MSQEAAEIKRRNAKLSDYYENLRTNVFSILGKQFCYLYLGSMWSPGPKPVMRVPDTDSQEKYDSYLTKLQNICTEPVGEEGTVKPVTESLKSALQNISVLPTPTPT